MIKYSLFFVAYKLIGYLPHLKVCKRPLWRSCTVIIPLIFKIFSVTLCFSLLPNGKIRDYCVWFQNHSFYGSGMRGRWHEFFHDHQNRLRPVFGSKHARKANSRIDLRLAGMFQKRMFLFDEEGEGALAEGGHGREWKHVYVGGGEINKAWWFRGEMKSVLGF